MYKIIIQFYQLIKYLSKITNCMKPNFLCSVPVCISTAQHVKVFYSSVLYSSSAIHRLLSMLLDNTDCTKRVQFEPVYWSVLNYLTHGAERPPPPAQYNLLVFNPILKTYSPTLLKWQRFQLWIDWKEACWKNKM